MAQQLIVDIGNTSAKVFFFEGDTLLEEFRVAHDGLCSLLATQVALRDIRAAILSSVVPLSDAMEEAIGNLPCPCLRMSSQLRLPFKTLYKTPHTLGPDRLAAAVGAWCHCPHNNLLVIDIGTAITYDIVTADALHLGGNISPGIDMRLKALNHFTGKLPLVSKEGERAAIGDTTETALREGVLQGVCYEIEGYMRAYANKYDRLLIFLTGGDANLLDNQTKNRTFADGLLVAKGLNHILLLNDETN